MNREFSLKWRLNLHAFMVFSLAFFCISLFVQADSRPNYSAKDVRTHSTVNFNDRFNNEVLLIVNVPMDCKGKGQFLGLQKLYQRYRDKGFSVIGLITNEFRPQIYTEMEPFLEECKKRYQVSFPLFLSNGLSGVSDDPLFKWLEQVSGMPVRDDFSKYLVSRRWGTVKGFSHNSRPDDIKLAVEIGRLLKGPAHKKRSD